LFGWQNTRSLSLSLGGDDMMILPPRPNAIVTFLPSSSHQRYLPGVQTLLYSLYKNVTTTITQSKKKKTTKTTTQGDDQRSLYPPEVVVMVVVGGGTANPTRQQQQQTLLMLEEMKRLCWCPHLCTRIVSVEEWPSPVATTGQQQEFSSGGVVVSSSLLSLTKLRVFGLQQYGTILFVDSTCLVLHDVSPLLDLLPPTATALTAAVPHPESADRFSASVLVLRPSTKIVDDMLLQYQQQQQQQAMTTLLSSKTTDVEAFLNDYFLATWSSSTDTTTTAHLAAGYCVYESSLYGGTDKKCNEETTMMTTSSSNNMSIVHFDKEIKPWEYSSSLSETTTMGLATKNSEYYSLLSLYHAWLQESQQFCKEIQQTTKKSSSSHRRRTVKAKRPPSSSSQHVMQAPPPSSAAASMNDDDDTTTIHRLMFHRRFKQLRKEGLSMEAAMTRARQELQPEEQQEEIDPGRQVAAMFGMF
jgi:hypothetical protein